MMFCNKKNIFSSVTTLALLGMLGLQSTAQANTPFINYYQSNTAPTITEIVAQSGDNFDNNSRDYDILLRAVVTAGLGDALADTSANFTVLAPNDRAFIRLAQDLGFTGNDEAGAFDSIVSALTTLGNGDPIPVLTNILLYHVVPEALSLRQLVWSTKLETLLSDATITPNRLRLIDNEPDVKNPRYVYPINVRASNGVVQTINRVLLPIDIASNNSPVPTDNIVDVVLASGGAFDNDYTDFDILLNAVQTVGLVDALAAVDADLTVFAPNDAAFVRLARDLGYRGFDETGAFSAIVDALTELGGGDPVPLLTNILLYHVSPGSKTVKQVTDLESVSTLLDDASFQAQSVFLIDGAPRIRSPRIKTNASNIITSNGIIHTINRVLIPLDIEPSSRYRLY